MTCLAFEQNYRLVATAVTICILGSVTSAMMLQRALGGKAAARLRWLMLAGTLTGLTIWATHFAAMVCYAPGVEVGFDAKTSIASGAAGILLSTAGWVVAFACSTERGVFGGALVGTGLLAAHFLDTAALKVAGTISYDIGLITLSISIGLFLAAASGWLMQRNPISPLALPTAFTLAISILLFHFVAMAGITIKPTAGALDARRFLDRNAITTVVIVASTAIIAAALALSFQRVAKATGRERSAMAMALAALRTSEAHHRASVELNPQIPWVADANGNVIEIAPRWGELVGASADRALGTGWADVVHPEDLPGVQQTWKAVTESGRPDGADTRYRIKVKDGGYRWFRVVARPRVAPNGGIIAWYGSLEDIDDQVKAELALRDSEERYRLASRATNDVIWDWSADTTRITWAGAFSKVFGYTDFQGGDTPLAWWRERIHPDDRDRVWSDQVAAITDRGRDHWDHEYRFLRADGEYINVYSRGYLQRDASGRTKRVVGSIMDITVHKRREEELQWSANHDPLTGLPNRALYAERLEAAIAQSRSYGGQVALVVADLNNFKTLNDTLGHAVGDAALREVAQRLCGNVPSGSTVARLGGDEFAIILPDLADRDAGVDMAAAILKRISKPLEVDGRNVEMSLSAGIATYPVDAETAEDLLRSADLALYAAKSDVMRTIKAFIPQMRHAAEHRQRMLDMARTALDNNRVQPFYQAKVCLRTAHIVGFEALLRWRDEEGYLRGPAEIAAAFEDADLAVRLTDCIVDGIHDDCLRWQTLGIEYGRIAFNVTSADFRRGDLADRVLEKVRKAGLSAASLELEVTESVFLDGVGRQVDETLAKLRAAGMTVALDDFGTGYASLTHLQQFPVDVLKIDRSFVARLTDVNGSGGAIVNAVLGLAKSLGIKTVAEGVETSEHAEYLRAKGCDMGQGYLFSKPVGAAFVPGLLSRDRHLWSTWYADEADQSSTPLIPSSGGEPKITASFLNLDHEEALS
jgi:diguanylate cyclase (GGDEF)-like protein/PAS domain S-box-containing protein